MATSDYLQESYPLLGQRLSRARLADLPTPVRRQALQIDGSSREISVKYDNLTSGLYGGNKVRKLEYIFPRARERHCLRVATFGAAGSNHALATALHARQAGLECTCFLSHQAQTSMVGPTLNAHLHNGTEVVLFGGSYKTRLQTLRESLWGRHTWVIPLGGSSWLGTIGFVAAGLELACQVAAGEIEEPDKIYVGAGTMGTAVGIALGTTLAGLKTEVNAVRVSDKSIMNIRVLKNLMRKTVTMMHTLDAAISVDLADKTKLRIRDAFFGPGYAQTTAATDEAVQIGREQLGLDVETTYTGKTLAALLADVRRRKVDGCRILYWHTYNGSQLDDTGENAIDRRALPEEFLKYYAA